MLFEPLWSFKLVKYLAEYHQVKQTNKCSKEVITINKCSPFRFSYFPVMVFTHKFTAHPNYKPSLVSTTLKMSLYLLCCKHHPLHRPEVYKRWFLPGSTQINQSGKLNTTFRGHKSICNSKKMKYSFFFLYFYWKR